MSENRSDDALECPKLARVAARLHRTAAVLLREQATIYERMADLYEQASRLPCEGCSDAAGE